MAEFSPSFLYNAEGQARVFDDEAEYQAALEAGWKDSPASFGIETHPSNPAQAVLAQPPAPTPTAGVDLAGLYALLTSMQASQANDAALIGELQARVAILEAGVTPAPVDADPEQAAHAGQRRR